MSDRMTAVLLSLITSFTPSWSVCLLKVLDGSTEVRILFLNHSTSCKVLCMSVFLQNWFCALSQFLQTVSTPIFIVIYMFLIHVVTGLAFCNWFV